MIQIIKSEEPRDTLVDWTKVQWKKYSDVQIAEMFGVTRQWVNQHRPPGMKHEKPPYNPLKGKEIDWEQYLTIKDIAKAYGVHQNVLHYHAPERCKEFLSGQAERYRNHYLNKYDWRLPSTELHRIYPDIPEVGFSKLRKRYNLPKAEWDARKRDEMLADSRYHECVAAEKERKSHNG